MPKDPDLPLGKTLRLDRETTTLAAAGRWNRDNTPGPGLRDDWPDPQDCVTETGLPTTGPLVDAFNRVLASFGRGAKA